MSEEHTLIVEDGETIRNVTDEYLEKDYICVDAYSGAETRLVLQHTEISLILFDLVLPRVSREQLLEKLKQKQLPITVLPARGRTDDRMTLLNEGVGDCLCKPFDSKELKARIQAQLYERMSKREHTTTVNSAIPPPGFCHLETQGMKIRLTRHEYRIPELLMRDAKRAHTKKEIYEYAWENDYLGDDKTINVRIGNIRSKLHAVSKHECIETIWGIGFKWKN